MADTRIFPCYLKCPAQEGQTLSGSGTLSNGLAAEEVEGEGAEEGWDAVLAQQVEFDELPDGSGELRFQKLHFSTGGAGGLMGEKNKPINTRGFKFTSHDTGAVSP